MLRQDGGTALYQAAAHNSVEAAELLLAAKASLEVSGFFGEYI